MDFPDTTARRSSEYRAAHQVIEGGSIFSDPLAGVLLDKNHKAISDEEMRAPPRRPIRLFMACRARFAADAAAEALSRGVRQVVLLGAGLDTFSLRQSPQAAAASIFEVDEPSLQSWKMSRLTELNISLPLNVRFVPVDFERDDFLQSLQENGFKVDQPSCFLWLGVCYYLTPETVDAIMGKLGELATAELVFDYIQPVEEFNQEVQDHVRRFTQRLAEIGEPWICFLQTAALHRRLAAVGLTHIHDLSAADITRRYLPGDTEGGTMGCPLNLVHARHSSTTGSAPIRTV